MYVRPKKHFLEFCLIFLFKIDFAFQKHIFTVTVTAILTEQKIIVNNTSCYFNKQESTEALG